MKPYGVDAFPTGSNIYIYIITLALGFYPAPASGESNQINPAKHIETNGKGLLLQWK